MAGLCVLMAASPAVATPPAAGWLGAGEATPIAATTTRAGSTDDVIRYVNQQRDALHLPGVAVVVLRGGRALVSKGFGVAGPDGPAVTAATPFLLGSTSKQFTGLMVQQLIARGRLSLDTSAHEVLPWFDRR